MNFYNSYMNVMPINFTFTDGKFIPKKSMSIKNKRRRAHLVRTKRGGQKYKKHILR